MIRNRFFQRLHGSKSKRKSTAFKGVTRRASFEPLESRNLLSVTLPTISNQSVLAGAPLNLALHSTGTTNPVSYTVSVDNSNVNAAVPTGNTYLKLTIDDTGDGIHGDLVFQLFNDLAPKTVANFVSLINQDPNFYNGKTFHRIIEDFMIQGGDPNGDGTGGPGYKFDDEFNANLKFTGPGLLAMANSGPDTNGSQFFITTDDTRHLDFKHTIFGMLVQGSAILDALDSVPTGSSDKPLSTVTITSATIITDNLDGVLRLSAPNNGTGSSVVTVTAKDTVTNETSVQQFTVTLAADTSNERPFLGTINPIQTTVGTPITFNIPATDVEGDAIYYFGNVSPSNSNLTLTVNSATGQATLTPSASLAPGVYVVRLGVARNASSVNSANPDIDAQYVPVYINPAAPTGVQLLAASDTGASNSDRITSLNNSESKGLQFQVNGVISGASVELFADGVKIGSAVATGTSVVITTDGSTELDDGSYLITAKQTLRNKPVVAGNLNTSTDLASALSASLTLTVDTTTPQIAFTPITTASVGHAYNSKAGVSGETDSMTYELTQAPAGMTVNASTGLITWPQPASQPSPVNVTLKVTDKAGNSNQTSYAISIVPPNTAPTLTAASPVLGNTSEETPIIVSLASFINHGTGSTTINDTDSGAAVGGIALTSLAGHGTWAYSLDGTTFQTIQPVSASSALLLPSNASLRYTPDGKNGESVSITYRAWDTTAGTSGGRMDVSLPALVGENTAFSANTDTATLTVTAVNDAPVLTPATPSLGTTDLHVAKIINLSGTFINNGTGTTTITDLDDGAVLGGIAIYAVTGNGAWAYSLDGTTFVDVGLVSSSTALLLPKTALLRYTPNGTSTETPTISYHAWDTTVGTSGSKIDVSQAEFKGGSTGISTLTDIATLSVVDVNDAPVVTPASPSLGTTTEDTAITINLSGTGSFINNGTGTTTIVDADAGNALGGIAIIGLTGAGKWEYSLDGTSFVTISNVSASSALLLPKTAKLKYTPDLKNGESATIVYRAWDATSGANGGRVNLSQSSALGGETAFSVASDTATLNVTGVNDAPVVTAKNPSLGTIAPNGTKTFDLSQTFINYHTGSTTITDVDASAVLGGIALTGITGSGIWEYSTDGTTFTSVGTISSASALLLTRNSILRYTASGSLTDTPTIAFRGWDTTTGTNGSKVDLSASGAVGGSTAFSSATDSATLAVAGGSLSGFVYIDLNNDGSRSTSGGWHYGLPGVAVKLLKQDTSGSWTEVAGRSPVLTGADGSYHFNDLIAGTYRIQEIQPANFLDGIDTAGKVSGAAKGTAGADTLDIQLVAGESGTEYNFGEMGLVPQKISLRMFLASSSTDAQIITEMNAAPTVDLSAAVSGNGYSTSVNINGASIAVAASDAKIADLDSAAIASMTVTLTNVMDGNAETLAADVTSTSITSNYANGVLTLSGAATLSVYQQVLRSLTYKNTAAAPHAGVRTINIVASDGITSSAPATATVSVVTGPAGYSITANDSLINPTEASNTSFTFAGATVGATYNYTVSSSGGSGTVTGTGTITSATQQITGINVSTLQAGTLTFSVKLTDTNGNVGTVVTATATLDKTAPTGYTITANDSLINSSEAANTGFTFAGAEVGATYSYTVSTSGGTETVTGTGTITSATQQITGINVSALLAGTLTFSVTLTDPAGNAGAARTATANLDKTAPTGYTIAANDSLVNSTEAANTGFTFTAAEVGATYSCTVSSSNGGTPVTKTGTIASATQQITAVDVSSLPGGTLTYSVTLTDTAGNVGTAATATATLDKTAPTGYTITANDSLINLSEAANTGFTFAGADIGSTYTYTVTSSGGGTPVTNTGAITSATQQITSINVSSLPAGTLTFSVTLTDTAGNVGTAATATATLDKTAPTGYTITANDSLINFSEAANASFTFAGADIGSTYTYTVTSSGGGTPVTNTGTITSASQQITGINVSSLPAGTLTFSVTLTDMAGNVGTAATATATLDKTGPTSYSIVVSPDTILPENAATTSITFTNAEVGAGYSLIVTTDGGTETVTKTGTITAVGQLVENIDVSALPNGLLTYSVILTDSAGNAGSAATAQVTKTTSVSQSLSDLALQETEDWLSV